ncbi:MAG: glycosyltransferase [Deltaproteobacteria bacterium]|nr:glycosyltransferase [Deltaproteobacteria bacterium]
MHASNIYMEDLKFSVVTVSLNQGEFIKDNIESVLSQNYANFEHIVVDGGSTDGTLDILKSYPHLHWTSGKDRNQSHALNKGFARCTGDIIVWLNSDDYLAPGVFHELAPHFKEHRIILTPAAQTDRAGNVTEVVRNIDRSWFDLLRFWVPYAWLAQTGVFFRRDLLEEVKLEPGVYVNEDLNFVMDFDLFMRMADRADLIHPTEKVCAYYRIYETNKTGAEGEATQRELRRVFRRQLTARTKPERTASIMLPVKAFDDSLNETFASISRQNLHDIEIILLNMSPEIAPRAFAKTTRSLDLSAGQMSIRCAAKQHGTLLEAYNSGFETVSGSTILLLETGDILEPNYCLHAANMFSSESVGAMLAVSEIGNTEGLQRDINSLASISELFQLKILTPRLAFRKVLIDDIGGFELTADPVLGVPHFLARALFECWHVVASKQFRLTQKVSRPEAEEMYLALHRYLVAQTIVTLGRRLSESAYVRERAKYAPSRSIDPASVVNSKRLLEKAPRGWEKLDYIGNKEKLKALTESHPEFEPGWYYLGKLCRQTNESESAEICARRYHELSQGA